MSPVALSVALLAIAASFSNSLANAQDGAVATFPATPLASKHFAYPTGLPYQADSEHLLRGTQTGYNQCNSTTEGQNSLCQTSFVNSADDFCLWAPIEPNSLISNTEGEEVAWCTKPGRGTRVIPEGTLKGIQFMRTPDYVQVVGFIDQTKINIADGDFGGELDPHGADLRGNPLGGLMYSNAWSGNNNTFQQVIEWHNFMGGNAFCIKVCDPSKSHAADYCQHIFDRIGCAYNAPNNAQTGVFESCQGENQDFPGVYTTNGQVVTYTQPPESLGAISTMPYQPRVPASSNCVQFQSTALFAALASVTAAPGVSSSSSTSASVSATVTGSATGSAAVSSVTGSRGGSAASSGTPSGTAQGANATSNDASVVMMSGLVSFIGVVFSALFLS
ncbi:hypothetical protein PC9H_011211 [Pleurotus ostreatus]|uniref:Mannoprotein n=1 Tax=Pleurotus ostreatus TaxID=5322 RepID=A0A8H6ZL91_PLEOS|nr:uncharacterized protein PC9H_011211 [Pleurotus ostreatus]KAF7423047.1 hypothetical protein PC9H_011211 [Pleurotus ostreatus]KAJ8690941.1 hypothetical protein PTI98_010559 [Pleurotus ostreatus]KAJ8690942.1 hypothetical protein PTI98_010559 [Pleurotus ostreatus]